MEPGGTALNERSWMLHERAQTAAQHAQMLVVAHGEVVRAVERSVADSRSSRAARQENPTGVRQRLPKPLVLFLEDDADLRAAHAYALREAEMEVDEAASIQEAHDALASALPDVVIADRRLPDGDGFKDFVAVIRREPWGKYIPCIALTGATAAKDIEAAVLSGCDVYLVKPVAPDVVVTRVREQLGAAIKRRLGSA